jgi:hypothetical protein
VLEVADSSSGQSRAFPESVSGTFLAPSIHRNARNEPVGKQRNAFLGRSASGAASAFRNAVSVGRFCFVNEKSTKRHCETRLRNDPESTSEAARNATLTATSDRQVKARTELNVHIAVLHDCLLWRNGKSVCRCAKEESRCG